jgi:hypothetical protein
MAVKGKYRRGKTRYTNRKRSMNSRRHTTHSRRHNRTQYRRPRCIRGGNYSTDVTTQTYLGFPMKASNKVVTTVPGYGAMSVSAYKNLMESKERNGFD